MTTLITTTTSNNQVHNDIMAAGSRDRPPMLAMGRYAQWQSRFMRYVNTKPNSKELKQCIFKGESLNKQDVKTNLFWEFGKFTSRDEESIESYYSRFYKMINEMYQNEINEIHAEKLARSANPLAFIVAAQHYLEYHNQTPKPHKPNAPSSRQITSSKLHATTRSKGKLVVKLVTTPSELASEEDNDTDEELDEQELEAHYMYMAKIQEVLTAKSGTSGILDESPSFDAEPLKQVQIDDDYNVFTNERHHSKQLESINDTYVVEKVDSNVIPNSSDMCDNEGKADQNAKENVDERVVLANLIANLKLDTDENKKIQKQLEKENASLAHELKECKSTLEESNDIRDRCRSELHHEEIEKYKMYKYCTTEKDKVERKKPCLYKIPYDKDDLANIFDPNREEAQTLEQESISKLHKETVKQYDHTYQNSLYEIFTSQTREYLDQLYYANEARKKM
ncbi:hypothetical protein Tco_0586873 [Tanacetum coccineum]